MEEESDGRSDNLFHNIDILERDLLGRTLLGRVLVLSGQVPDDTRPADVWILRTSLGGLARYRSDGQPRSLWDSVAEKIAIHPRTTHWAARIRGDIYETFRHEEYRWPWNWRATLRMKPMEEWKKDPGNFVVEEVRVGTTSLSNRQIAWIGSRYVIEFRPYSLFGDNCQQFIMQFCHEISVEFDHRATQQLRTATDVATFLCVVVMFSTVTFFLDIFWNQARLSLSSPLPAVLALLTMILLVLVHPRIFLADVAPLGPTLARLVMISITAIVSFIWITIAVVLCFSFENACDDIVIHDVDGVQVFDVWHPCNIALRIAQFFISSLCVCGMVYHSYYSSYFIEGR